MITKFKKILFYADGARGEKAALARAQQMAVNNGAELTVVDVVASVSTNDVHLQSSIKKLQMSLIRDRGLALDKLISTLPAHRSKSVTLKKQVVPGKGYLEVIKLVVSEKFDLVVKAVNSKSAITAALFGDNDIRLLHFCPCPVLILKPGRRRKLRNILAAVDPVTGDRAGTNLNNAILETAISVAEIEMADLHVLHVWELPLEDFTELRVGKGTLDLLSRSLKEDAERKLNELVQGYTRVPLYESLRKGKPHKVIPKFVRENDIDLLLMGTVARSGVPGFLVGNTAEKILSQVDCSVLALKPKGWKTPIK